MQINLNNNQPRFTGFVKRVNDVSEQLSRNSTVKRVIAKKDRLVHIGKNGDPAIFKKQADGSIRVDMPNIVRVKGIILHGIGKNKSEAAQNLLAKLDKGVEVIKNPKTKYEQTLIVNKNRKGIFFDTVG